MFGAQILFVVPKEKINDFLTLILSNHNYFSTILKLKVCPDMLGYRFALIEKKTAKNCKIVGQLN